MNALVKKEIRQLFPCWITVLVLETLVPQIWTYQGPNDLATLQTLLFIFFLGLILLAVDSFGREFSLGTFGLLLSQPIQRQRIWQAKTRVLAAGSLIIFLAYAVSTSLRMDFIFLAYSAMTNSGARSDLLEWGITMLSNLAVLAVALTGGLWTTLLLRQIATAFWFTLLTPLVLVSLTLFSLIPFLPSSFLIPVWSYALFAVGGIYSVAGYWLARRLFIRGQDLAWTGGVIHLSKWRYFAKSAKISISRRRRGVVRALLQKEFQLHSISLFCASLLLALHLIVILVRPFLDPVSVARFASDSFWLLWLIVPFALGCSAVAEERGLAVMDEQFCLAVSRKMQFMLKFVLVLFWGFMLGGILPVALEILATRLGSPNEIIKTAVWTSSNTENADRGFVIAFIALSAGVAGWSFYASSLCRNFIQAMSVSMIGCVIFALLIDWLGNVHCPLIFDLLALLVIPTTLVWLAWNNFNYFGERRRLWLRNVSGVVGSLILVLGGSTAIQNRVWENFEPAEPPHGPARLSLANAPKLRMAAYEGDLQLQWPEGRVWYDHIDFFRVPGYFSRTPFFTGWWSLFPPSPASCGPQQLIEGSNWLSTSLQMVVPRLPGAAEKMGYLNTVGVRFDGTLWIANQAVERDGTLQVSSQERRTARAGTGMSQVGGETNWLKLARYGYAMTLLKTDGTFWFWRPNSNGLEEMVRSDHWTNINNAQPRRIGMDSDWNEIAEGGFVKKQNGTAWRFYAKEGTFSREPSLDQVVLETFSLGSSGAMSYIGPDGRLFASEARMAGEELLPRFKPVGLETNWISVSEGLYRLVALKSDGSLWHWDYLGVSLGNARAQIYQQAPRQLGVHRDSIGIGAFYEHTISLAADGSLWLWPDLEGSDFRRIMKPSRRPTVLGNIFNSAE